MSTSAVRTIVFRNHIKTSKFRVDSRPDHDTYYIATIDLGKILVVLLAWIGLGVEHLVIQHKYDAYGVALS